MTLLSKRQRARFFNYAVARADPKHSLDFGNPLTEDGQTLEIRNRVNLGFPKYRERKNTGVAPFSATCAFYFFPHLLGAGSRDRNPPRHRHCGSQ